MIVTNLKSEFIGTVTISLNFSFEIVQSKNYQVYLKVAGKATIIKVDLSDVRNTQNMIVGRDIACGIIAWSNFFCFWKPWEGRIFITDFNSNCSFPIYYACLGRSDIRNSDGEKTRFLDLVSSTDGLIVKIEKCKYILVEF